MRSATPRARGGLVLGHAAWVGRPAAGGDEGVVDPGRAGRALLELVDTAVELGLGWLTIQEPSGGEALRARAAELAGRGVLVADCGGAFGDGAPGSQALAHLEGPGLRVLLAEEGSGRRELLGAVRELAARSVEPAQVSEATIAATLAVPDVDLLVLTGGDRRVPDLLVWQVAYSEIVVLDDPWPDVAGEQFRAAVAEFRRRERRYGGLVASR
ncbi:MAG: undecaprenyl diphosphate synthase family protein [Actinomycetota bacterium]|nr:undecaprenyl diphosphate synthase family protein [Actinomycetota bacterium]